MDEIAGLFIWTYYGGLVGMGAYSMDVSAESDSEAPKAALKGAVGVGLAVQTLMFFWQSGVWFVLAVALSLTLSGLTAYFSAKQSPRFGRHPAAILAGINSGIVAFLVMYVWLWLWPLPY